MTGRSVADMIWCGASAPIVEGFLVGLGFLTVGLAVFPFQTIVIRPAGGPQRRYARAVTAIRTARVLSWPLMVLAPATLIGYITIYVGTGGKSCDATLTPTVSAIVIVWAAAAGATAALLVVAGILRSVAGRTD